MGTTYHVTYFDARGRDFQSSVDSLLAEVNRSINMYDLQSEVSKFNQARKGVAFRSPHLRAVLHTCDEVFAASRGAFDPTVMPLVNAWGFGPGKHLALSHATIDSLLAFTGFEHITITADSLLKDDPRVQLDFGGIGQGYGADMVAAFLRSKGVQDYLVELGGEGIAAGKNLARNQAWRIGIIDPNSTRDDQYMKAYVSLNNQSFTTAGNYFNYRVIDGRKYSHTIHPATGYPVEMPVLSVSVFAADCTVADAWDTALMVMGHERAIKLLQDHRELEALLMFTGTDGGVEVYTTPGISHAVTLEP